MHNVYFHWVLSKVWRRCPNRSCPKLRQRYPALRRLFEFFPQS